MRAALSKKEHRILREGFVAQGCSWRESAHNFLFTTPDGQTFGIAKTASDSRSNKNARADARRVGMHWPLDPPSTPARKAPTSMIESAPTLDGRITPLQIQRQSYAPTRAAVERMLPYATAMPEEFWTHELLEQLRTKGVRGFAGGSGNSRLIVLLWHQGYRVVGATPERGGFRFRWRHDATAEIPAYGLEGDVSAKVTPISAQVEQPVDEVRTHPEYDRGLEEGMEAGAEEIGALRRQLADANEEIGALRRQVEAAHDADRTHDRQASRIRELESERQRATVALGDAAQELTDMRAEIERWERSAANQNLVVVDPLPAGNDGSWILSEDEIGDQSLTALQRAGRSFGLRIEVRARRA